MIQNKSIWQVLLGVWAILFGLMAIYNPAIPGLPIILGVLLVIGGIALLLGK